MPRGLSPGSRCWPVAVARESQPPCLFTEYGNKLVGYLVPLFLLVHLNLLRGVSGPRTRSLLGGAPCTPEEAVHSAVMGTGIPSTLVLNRVLPTSSPVLYLGTCR